MKIPLCDNFLVLIILAANSAPVLNWIHLRTIENAPLEKKKDFFKKSSTQLLNKKKKKKFYFPSSSFNSYSSVNLVDVCIAISISI